MRKQFAVFVKIQELQKKMNTKKYITFYFARKHKLISESELTRIHDCENDGIKIIHCGHTNRNTKIYYIPDLEKFLNRSIMRVV